MTMMAKNVRGWTVAYDANDPKCKKQCSNTLNPVEYIQCNKDKAAVSCGGSWSPFQDNPAGTSAPGQPGSKNICDQKCSGMFDIGCQFSKIFSTCGGGGLGTIAGIDMKYIIAGVVAAVVVLIVILRRR